MSELNYKKIILRSAGLKDNRGLIRLTSLIPMDGTISIRIDRGNNFFSLLSRRGEFKVFLAECGDEIIGSISISKKMIKIQDQIVPLYYIGDLKIDSEYQGTTLVFRLLQKAKKYIVDDKGDLLFCTVASGNKAVYPLLKGRLGLPKFSSAGIFRIFQLVPLSSRINSFKNITFVHDHPKLLETYQKYYNTFGFAPLLYKKSLEDTSDCILVKEEEIVSAVSLVDVNIDKQNVIIDMPCYLKSLVRISKLVHWIPFIPNLPGKGEPIKILYVKYFYCKTGYEKSARKLIKHCLAIAKKKNYHFLTMGIHERDPVIQIIKGLIKFEFKSEGYLCSIKDHNLTDKILNTKIYEDYSLV